MGLFDCCFSSPAGVDDVVSIGGKSIDIDYGKRSSKVPRSEFNDSVKDDDEQLSFRRHSSHTASSHHMGASSTSSLLSSSSARRHPSRTPLQSEACWVGECLAAKDFAAVVLLRSHILQDMGAKHFRSSMQAHERTLRVIVHKAKSIAAATTHTYPTLLPLPHPSTLLLRDQTLAGLKDQLLRLCSAQRPGLEAFSEAEQLVAAVTKWVQSSPASQAAATALFVAGEALARVEHLIRNAGRPEFWSPAVVGLLLALLQLYSALIEVVTHPATAHTLARLLLRPALLDLLADAADLVSFSSDYQALCRGGRQEWMGAALQLWEFHMQLLRFGAAHAAAVGPEVLGAGLARAWCLLAPGGGLVVRLLEQPIGEATVAVQLQVLRFLRVLFDMPAGQHLLSPSFADHYIQYHFLECVKYYQSSRANPKSVSAEMCFVHLASLRSLARNTSAPVRLRFQQLRVLDFFLREFSLESEMLAGEPYEAVPGLDVLGERSSQSLLASSFARQQRSQSQFSAKSIAFSSASCSSYGDYSPRPLAERRAALAAQNSKGLNSGKQFEFTYDLNEDFERLCALEDELGRSVDFEGLDRSGGFGSSRSMRSAMANSNRNLNYTASSASMNFAEDSFVAGEGGGGGGGGGKGAGYAGGGVGESFQKRQKRISSATSMRSGVSFNFPSSPNGSRPASPVAVTAPKPFVVPKLTLGVAQRGGGGAGSPAAGGGGGTPTTTLSPMAAAMARATAAREAAAAAATGGTPDVRLLAAASPVPYAVTTTMGSFTGTQSRLAPRPTPEPAPSTPPGRHFEGAGARSGYSAMSMGSTFRGSMASVSRVLVHFEEEDEEDNWATRDRGDKRASSSGQVPQLSLKSMVVIGSGGRVMPSLNLGAAAARAAAAAESHSPPAPSKVPTLNFGNLKKGEGAVVSPMGATLGTAFSSLLRASAVLDSASDAQPSPALGPAALGGGIGGGPDDAAEQPSYAQMADCKLMYSDPTLHATALHLVLDLLMTPTGGLDPTYFVHFPLDNGLLNADHILMSHLNCAKVQSLVPALVPQLVLQAPRRRTGDGEDGLADLAADKARREVQPVDRVMRLLSRQLFNQNKYTNLQFQIRGAYGGIYRAKMKVPGSSAQNVVIKTIDLPTSAYERCVMHAVFGEVTILERYCGVDGFCQLIDYGLANDAYWLVMKRYRCSLYEWRARQKVGCGVPTAAVLYLNVLSKVVDAMKVLSRDHVVHFDIKCSNILLDPTPGIKDGELWRPTTCEPPFQAVLADFGEARAYHSASEAFTARIRGTEVYKSPEMLMLNNNRTSNSGGGAFTLGGRSGVGGASDVWSLGCVAYELLSGSILFAGDYATVTHRVAFGAGPALILVPSERAKLEDVPELVSLVEFILVRDPAHRPGLDAVSERIAQVKAKLMLRVGVASVEEGCSVDERGGASVDEE